MGIIRYIRAAGDTKLALHDLGGSGPPLLILHCNRRIWLPHSVYWGRNCDKSTSVLCCEVQLTTYECTPSLFMFINFRAIWSAMWG